MKNTFVAASKVVLVDDEPQILASLGRHLRDRFQVFSYASSSEALRMLRGMPDAAVIVVDYRMPEMDGLALIAEGRKAVPSAAWIMLSGYGDLSLALEAVNEADVFRFLTKPCTKAEFVEAVEEAVEHHRVLANAAAYTDESQGTVDSLLAALKEKDYVTEGHVTRVAKLCRKIGQAMQLSEAQLEGLEHAASMHDLGKIGIPDAILFKPGKLTKAEWQIMREHPEKGSRIALASPELQEIADIILAHHERWDGRGYPQGLKAGAIPLEARILAAADAYDVMTHQRSYQDALSAEAAQAELKACAGSQFDPDVITVLLAVVAGAAS